MTTTETVIYKITTRQLWEQGEAEGRLPYGPVDEKDGFMHFSIAPQLRESLRLYFSGQSDLILCAVPVAAVEADLKWEPARRGILFPHLYAELPIAVVAAHHAISVAADGSCDLPEGIA